MTDSKDRISLQDRLSYRFSNQRLLEEALRHSSYVNERPAPTIGDNERLEFLGDAVLNLVVGDILMDRYPQADEGELSRLRAGLVNETRLADLARKIDLGRCLLLGKGEKQSGGHEKNSILADAFEALMAAVYLDGGYDAAFRIIASCFADIFPDVDISTEIADYKSRLQEWVQSRQQEIPAYRVVGEEGPDHDKTFRVRVRVMEQETEGIGKSKKLAEQDAAKKAFFRLRPTDTP